MRTDSPCRNAPDLWFGSHTEQGQAIHICLTHCARLKECRETEAVPSGGVLAGVAYSQDRDPRPLQGNKQPAAVKCMGCRLAIPEDPWRPPTDTGRCGTNAGYGRHRYMRQHACGPCRSAHTAAAIASKRLRAKRAAA